MGKSSTCFTVTAAGLFAFLLASCQASLAPVEDPALPVQVAPTAVVAATATLPQLPTKPAPAVAPLPTATLPPTPTPTPQPELSRLTSGGCCVQPFFSPDGQRILFIDRPDLSVPAGLWSVSIQGGEPKLFTGQLGIFSNDMRLRAFPEGGQTYVERLEDQQRWLIPSSGRAVSFSPDNQWVAWTAGNPGPPFDTPQRQVWISRVDGSEPRLVTPVTGGSFAGWFPDGRLLISGRLQEPEEGQALWSVSFDGSQTMELARGSRIRSISISPGGRWLVYQITFSTDPTQNGIWLVDMDTGESSRLDLFGAYRWRTEGSLLIIPLDLGSPVHRIWQVDAATGVTVPLTSLDVTPFTVANGDWTVSPGGERLAFVSADDGNIWLMSLP